MPDLPARHSTHLGQELAPRDFVHDEASRCADSKVRQANLRALALSSPHSAATGSSRGKQSECADLHWQRQRQVGARHGLAHGLCHRPQHVHLYVHCRAKSRPVCYKLQTEEPLLGTKREKACDTAASKSRYQKLAGKHW